MSMCHLLLLLLTLVASFTPPFFALERKALAPNLNRKEDHGPSLSHHRAYGSATPRFDGSNFYLAAKLVAAKPLRRNHGLLPFHAMNAMDRTPSDETLIAGGTGWRKALKFC
jgi:hypothetical protein